MQGLGKPVHEQNPKFSGCAWLAQIFKFIIQKNPWDLPPLTALRE